MNNPTDHCHPDERSRATGHGRKDASGDAAGVVRITTPASGQTESSADVARRQGSTSPRPSPTASPNVSVPGGLPRTH
jgi:hypothetical protein